MKKSKISSIGKFLIKVFLIAFILRVLYISTTNNSVNVWKDWWDEIAKNILIGKGLVVKNPIGNEGQTFFYCWRTPVFPIIIAIIYAITGINNYFAVKIFLAFIGSVSCIFVYFIGKRIFDENTGKIASIFTAISPSFIFFSGYVAPIILTLFLGLIPFFFITRDIKRMSLFNYITGGIFLGIGVLCREILIIILLILPVWMFFYYRNKKEIIFRIFLFFAGFILTLSPWVIRNYRIYHKWILTSTNGIWTFYAANNESALSDVRGYSYSYDVKELKGLNEIELRATFRSWGINFIKKNPKKYFTLVRKRGFDFWRLYPHTISGPGKAYSYKHIILGIMYTLPMYFFGIVGFFYSLFRKQWKKPLLIYLFIFLYSLLHILFRSAIRFRIPVEPYLIIIASYGFVEFFKKHKKCKSG